MKIRSFSSLDHDDYKNIWALVEERRKIEDQIRRHKHEIHRLRMERAALSNESLADKFECSASTIKRAAEVMPQRDP